MMGAGRRAPWAWAALAWFVAGCATEPEPPAGTMPRVQIVGADLTFDDSPAGPRLSVVPDVREVGRVLAPPCPPEADCIAGEAANKVLPERTRLVANHRVRVRGRVVEPGADLAAALGSVARLRLAVSPFAIHHVPLQDVELTRWRTRFTASWETDEGLAFSASVTVRR